MSAARYTNRVRTQSQARVTKVQYPGTVSNNYDSLFSSINCNSSYNVLDYKGVPCICSPAEQPFLFGMRLGRINRTAAVQFSLPVSVDEPVVPVLEEINTGISVRMALPVVSNDPVPIPQQEAVRNVYVTLSVDNNTTENVPQRSYGSINTNIAVIGYAQKNETSEPAVLPTFEGIRNVRVMTQAPLPIPSTEEVSYPSYGKLRNIAFKIEVPIPVQPDPTPSVPNIGIIPKFEGIRSVGIPVTVPQLTNEPVHMPTYESIRNVRLMSQVPIHIPSPPAQMLSYPSYEKLRNISFKIEVPTPVQTDAISTIPDVGVIRRFEGIRSITIPVSVPLLTNDPASIPNYETIRNIPHSELDIDGIVPTYHLPGIRSFHSIQTVDRVQTDYVTLVDQTVAVPIYDVNSFRTNPRFRMPNNNVETQKEIVFGGGSENPDDYVVYGGGNSQLLL